MILRILLTLLILTYCTGEACVKINRETVQCKSLLDFNGTAKSILVSDCTDLVDYDNSSLALGPWPAVNNVTFDCTVTDFPWSFVDVFPNIRYVNLPKCNLTTLPWQSVYTESLKIVDLTSCPIKCNCQNQWMKADGVFERLKEPSSLRKCILDCEPGRIDLNETIITGNAGENVTIHVGIRDQFINRSIDKPYFEWAYAKKQHNYGETISQSSADLVITNLSREDVGLIGIRCWHCVDYLTTKVELRVKLPVKMEFVGSTREDTEFMVIQGYPIENITLAITKMTSNYSEINVLGTDTDSVYFSSLVVRPEKLSLFYQRTYRIFTRDAAEGDHLSGDLRFEICTLGSCDAVEKHFSHLGSINSTFDDSVIVYEADHSDVYIFAGFIILVIFIILTPFAIYFRKPLVSFLREKITSFRKRITWAQELQSRRASRETEETLLRLEERNSLSDYTNQTIPFISIGNITILERIGKGAFGEVYRGSWENKESRPVAVKTIKQAGSELEQEAMTISRLDHPNIVKLFGVTRDRGNLLLVFELMNLGDLRTYMAQRCPMKTTYAQFPPPLTEKEMNRICFEIITGVAYLCEQLIVHRDIAARNCLVSGACDMKCALATQRPLTNIKISDFGMSRQLYSLTDYYSMDHQGLLPVRWLPPEAVVQHKFTHMSDMWALGVTMWEVFTWGKQMPFNNLNPHEVFSYTSAGMLPVRPPDCSEEMYKLIRHCWHMKPTDRITAAELLAEPIFDEFRPPHQKGLKMARYVPPPPKNHDKNQFQETSFTNFPQCPANFSTFPDFPPSSMPTTSSVDSSAPESSEGEASGDAPLISTQDVPIFASA